MKKKGFTLIELLVVIAIIAMLLAILMPALNKVKRLAQRLVCATNLKGLGTAMMVYSNDDKYDQYPDHNRGGQHVWAQNTGGWQISDYDWRNNTTSDMTISASLYLLVREADVDPKSFVCKSSDQRAYEGQAPSDSTLGRVPELVELWDFGSTTYGASIGEKLGSRNCVSYAYQNPFCSPGARGAGFSNRPANSTGSASLALAADRNPMQDSAASAVEAGTADDWISKAWLLGNDNSNAISSEQTFDAEGVSKWEIQIANSFAHNREGQNVLFNDGHAEFTKQTNVGVENDNIYATFAGTDPTATFEPFEREIGSIVTEFNGAPRTSQDTVLGNDDFVGLED